MVVSSSRCRCIASGNTKLGSLNKTFTHLDIVTLVVHLFLFLPPARQQQEDQKRCHSGAEKAERHVGKPSLSCPSALRTVLFFSLLNKTHLTLPPCSALVFRLKMEPPKSDAEARPLPPAEESPPPSVGHMAGFIPTL